MPVTIRKNPRYTTRTASPRGSRRRERKATTGLRISAISPAMMKITSTFPAAFAIAHTRHQRERQQHQLHPPRHHHARWLRGGALLGRRVPAGGSPASTRSSLVGSSDAAAWWLSARRLLTLFPPSPEYG